MNKRIEELSDFEVAKAFFDRIKQKGFKLELRDYNNNLEGTEDYNSEAGQSFQLYGSDGIFAEVDFLSGDFYRIGGFSSGHWQDEVDWKKYI